MDGEPAVAASQPRSPSVGPLGDPVAEARRVIEAGQARGLSVRALGGVAVYLQAPAGQPLLPRRLKDLDFVTAKGQGRAIGELMTELGYRGEEMFNALRGSRRQLFHDSANDRAVDVFVGEFEMCHAIPVAERLDADSYTVPLAELLMTKLQIVELTERDERDIYTLCYHHEVTTSGGNGIEADVIAELCAEDWGLWRTTTATIERCRGDLAGYELDERAATTISGRLGLIQKRMDEAPKTRRWKRRSRVGDRIRWYRQPEET